MSTKRIVVSVISFVLSVAFIVSVVPLSYMVRNCDQSRRNVMGYYSEPENTIDMVYIGGSACYVYWEPLRAWDLYGMASYNFAVDSMVPQAIIPFIKECRKTQSPKLWIIDLRPFQYGDELHSEEDGITKMDDEYAIRKATDSLSYSKNRKDIIDNSNIEWEDRYSFYFDIAKYHSRFPNKMISLIAGDMSILDQMDNIMTHYYKGFAFVDWGGREKQDFVDYSGVTEELAPGKELNDMFIDMLDYCENEGLTVLFIVHAYNQSKEHKMKYNYMKRIIGEYGLGFLNTNDYYEEIGLDFSNDMYNANHVNIFGAEKYTDFLARYITEHYSLSDHRNDAMYDDWNACYIASLQETKRVKEITANSELKIGDDNE